MDAFRGKRLAPGSALKTDAEIDDWIRNNVITVNHPLGTCAMGGGPDAVLGPDLKVRGTEGLRVVDAAALPDMPSAHINAIVMMLAERASDLIQRPPAAGSVECLMPTATILSPGLLLGARMGCRSRAGTNSNRQVQHGGRAESHGEPPESEPLELLWPTVALRTSSVLNAKRCRPRAPASPEACGSSTTRETDAS